ncbi:AMP-binding protein [Variovorax humicola]|uniref:AMP-binding protein n=1 Tax=Variovorax humicola TaxID=1769758 RepID=A0ABU8WAB1_9BURK
MDLIASPTQPSPAAHTRTDATALLRLVEATLLELHPDAADLPPVTLASRLDQDLGLDSLARTELLLRAEQAFGVSLPEDALVTAEKVKDLLHALERGHPVDLAPAKSAPRPSPAPLAPPAPDAAGEPASASTLLEVLAWHAREHPGRTQVTVLQDGEERPITYGALAADAAALAAGLQALGVAPRETVAIMLPTCPEYFSTYLGILMAGAIPVPIYPPGRPSQIEEHVLRHAALLDNARAVALVTVPEGRLVARMLQARVKGLRTVLTPQQLTAHGATPAPLAVSGKDVAFIQYTSGSTGSPKGVVLSHANLLANIRAMAQAIEASPADVFVSWLPLYHDMGLIGAWLGSLYVGMPLVVMSPLAFLARPSRWLQALQRWRGTISAGPNFAYELCLRQIDDAALADLDLRSVRLLFNGAEAVSAATVRRFSERFAACGLRAEAMAPVYGLAESSVGLLFPPLGRVAPVDAVQREAFSREGRALSTRSDDANALRFVGCGRPLSGHAVRIVDGDGHELGERQEGRLEFRGPSATHGYFRDPQKTAQLLHDGWLDSGDRAYAAAGDIYITGRVKDIVIRAGRNLYPQEIEDAVGQVEGIRKGCVAVFGSPDVATGTERLVVLAEARPATADEPRLRQAVARAVIDTIGEPPDDVVLAPPHTVLKTSSGKIRRSACRALYEGRGGRFGPDARHLQLLRLAAGAARMQLARAARSAGELLFAMHGALVFGLLAPPAWLLTVAQPRPARAWAVSRAAARVFFALTGMAPRIEGLQNLPEGPCVLVSNHGSYLDGAILLAALSRPCVFVAKAELGPQRVVGLFLRRLGAVFVERFDPRRAAEDTHEMTSHTRRGDVLLVFPEGTFGAAPGLLPFRLGAFLTAAQAQVPVAPVVLHGNRAALPDGSWRLRRVRLEVEVLPPVPQPPPGELLGRAVRLRDAAYAAMAARVDAGEEQL